VIPHTVRNELASKADTEKVNVLISVEDQCHFGMDSDPHLRLTDPDSTIFVSDLKSFFSRHFMMLHFT
jgi:hypothetical protein